MGAVGVSVNLEIGKTWCMPIRGWCGLGMEPNRSEEQGGRGFGLRDGGGIKPGGDWPSGFEVCGLAGIGDSRERTGAGFRECPWPVR